MMRKDIASLRRRPLPDLSYARELRKKTRSHPIDFSHPLINERLVDIREYDIAGENYYYMERDNPPYYGRLPGSIPHLFLRETVVRRLAIVNERLRLIDVEIFVLDAYRPVSFQDQMYNVWMPNDVRRRHPEWCPDDVQREVNKYWGRGSDEYGVVDPASPPLHSTGGAIDEVLRNRKTKQFLNMGCGFDEFSDLEIAFTDFFENLAKKKPLSLDEKEALENRRLLYWALVEEGFTNNPNEVWHADLYDQMWAALREAPAAFYSIAFAPFID